MADDETALERVPTSEGQRRGLLAGLLVPPLCWLAQLQANYALVTWVCASGHRVVLALVSLLAVAASAGAGSVAWRSWPGEGRRGGEPRGVEGARLLSLVGAATAAMFVIVILANMIPMLVLGPCD